MEREKISIIIPTYNRADCIEKSIRSVLEQTYREFELLIVDDGSSDNTEDVVNRIGDERIRYIKMPENKGAAAARNEGIRQAAYDYIAFQDSDDWWKPDKLEKQMQVLMDNPQAGLVYCEFEYHAYDGSVVTVPGKEMPPCDKQGDIYDKLLCQNTISTQTVVARRECLLKVGLFCEKLRCLEDWEFFLRIAKDYEIAFLEEVLVDVYYTAGSVTFNVAGYFEARCYMIAQHKEALIKYGKFGSVVEEVFVRAQMQGVLEQVNKMMLFSVKREKVSIIIPTYNRADCIEKSIRSVLEQTYQEFELLIVDDGSSDNTEEVVTRIGDERIRYIKMPENKGAAAARNEGIRQAAYDYIAFQDSDDWWKPDKLEKQMQALMDNPQAGMVYCEYECYRYDGDISIAPDEQIPLYDKQGDIYYKLLCRNTIGAPTVLARRECFFKAGLFCESLTCLEDWELFVRIAKAYEILFIKEPLVIVHLAASGVSSNIAGYYEARCYMIAQHREALLKCGQFNNAVEEVLLQAQKRGILEQVNKMLQVLLSQPLS